MSEAPEKKSKGNRSLLIGIILVLLLLNAYFLYKNVTGKKELEVAETETKKLDSLYRLASEEIKLSNYKLDSLVGRNASLDSLLRVRIQELDDLKGEIDEMLRRDKLNSNELSALKKKIQSLTAENSKFVGQIEELNAKVKQLTMANDSLTVGLTKQIGENQKLSSENVILSKKVELGSLLRPENVVATGIRFKGDSKEVPVTSAKKAEKLKFCFDVPENKVADPGEKIILLRLLNPSGATIAIESEGSGVFELAETKEKKQFTMKKVFTYDGKAKNLCIYWQQTAAFESGTYTAMFYQDGYLLKETKFELK